MLKRLATLSLLSTVLIVLPASAQEPGSPGEAGLQARQPRMALPPGSAAEQAPTVRTPTPPPQERQPAPAKAPEPPGQNVNIRLQITITDQGGAEEAPKKVVTMILADRASGSIRSSGQQRSEGRPTPVTINIDAQPTILRDGTIRLNLGLEYWPVVRPDGTETPAPVRGQLTERLGLLLVDGKPVVISEAADAATNRRVTIELLATVLK